MNEPDRVRIEVDADEVKFTLLVCVLWAAGTFVSFVSSATILTIATSGMSKAFERLAAVNEGAAERLKPFLQRLEVLFSRPEDLGFPLLAENETDYTPPPEPVRPRSRHAAHGPTDAGRQAGSRGRAPGRGRDTSDSSSRSAGAGKGARGGGGKTPPVKRDQASAQAGRRADGGGEAGTHGGHGRGISAYEMDDFIALEHKEHLYEKCRHIQEGLAKALNRYRKAMIGGRNAPPPSLERLKEDGFLKRIPRCPSGAAYEVESDWTVTCPVHGSLDTVWPGHELYLQAFEAYNSAAAAMENNRPEDAEMLLRALLKRCPNHPYAIFLMGRVLCRLKRWKEAADLLNPLARHYRDVKVQYYCGLAFYGADNQILALERLRMCGRCKLLECVISNPSMGEFYLTKDKAAWTMKHVEKGTRFRDFLIEKPPMFPSAVCRKRLERLHESITRAMSEYAASPFIMKFTSRIARLKKRMLFLQDFEKEKKKEIEAKLERYRKKLKEKTYGFGPDSLLASIVERLRKQEAEDDSCPTGDPYLLDDSWRIQCPTHPDILESPSLERLALNMSERHRMIINAVLLVSSLKAKAPETAECLERQLELLRGAGTARSVCPVSGARLRKRDDGFSCPSHGSLAEKVKLLEKELEKNRRIQRGE